jgi:hypothetical protein
VKQSNLGEYEENVREKQNIQYTGKATTPHQTKPCEWQTPIPPQQISRVRSIKGFGEDISQLFLGVYVSHLNVSLLYMISQEVVSSVNMSHIFVED